MQSLPNVFARLRRLFRKRQAPPPEPVKTQGQVWRYSVIVERPGQPDETYLGHVFNHAVQEREPLTISSIEYVVVEVVNQAEPGVRDGTLRAKPAPTPPPLGG